MKWKRKTFEVHEEELHQLGCEVSEYLSSLKDFQRSFNDGAILFKRWPNSTEQERKAAQEFAENVEAVRIKTDHVLADVISEVGMLGHEIKSQMRKFWD